METEPDTENVLYIDEYPELAKRVWLRRLAAQRLSQVVEFPKIIKFPTDRNPNGAA